VPHSKPLSLSLLLLLLLLLLCSEGNGEESRLGKV